MIIIVTIITIQFYTYPENLEIGQQPREPSTDLLLHFNLLYFFILRSAAWYLRYCSSAVIFSEGRDGKPYGRTCCPKKNCEVQGTGSWKTWGSNITRHRKGSIQVAWSFVASLVGECWRILRVYRIRLITRCHGFLYALAARLYRCWLSPFCFRFPTMHAVMQT